jgi:hypothetical protein
MYPRTNYEMTEAQLEKLLEACKSTVVMKIGNYSGSSPQENANRAWEELGKKMGFDHMTVKPITRKGTRFFSAIPIENETQKKERLEREKEDKRLQKIKQLKREITEKQSLLNDLGKK